MPEEERLSHEELVEDVRAFVSTVESTHPAPFVRAGGRFAYYGRVQSVLDDLPSSGSTDRELRKRVAALAADVRDAHTFVATPMAEDEIPVRLRVIDGDVRVTAVRDGVDPDLIGSALVSVDGVERDELLQRQRRLRGSETEHGPLANLALSLRNWRSMRELLDRDDRPERATFQFRSPDGTVRRETLEPTPAADGGWTHRTAALERPSTDGWPAYRLLDDEDVAWLRVPTMTDYREKFEFRGDSLDEGALEEARAIYRRYAGGESSQLDDDGVPEIDVDESSEIDGCEPPENEDDVLAGLPSALEIFRHLADEMAAAESEALIVDLRGNQGGVRVLVDLLAYVFYGWDGVRTARERPGALRYSDRFVEERSAEPFEFASDGRDWDLRPGEYAINDGDLTVDEAREDMIDAFDTFERLEVPDELSAGRFTPVELVVLTSATTFSAGLSLAATLRRLGAIVVGTPPIQAPTYYGDVVSFDLPNSDLTALTATSRVELLPDGPDDVLRPDRELTVEDWARYDFDRDAAVRLAIDECCGESSAERSSQTGSNR